jgi:hypothetical protein
VYRSEISRNVNSGSIISLHLNKNQKLNTNIAIDTGEIEFSKLDDFNDGERKNDFYFKNNDREGFYAGLYMIYIASNDQEDEKERGGGRKIFYSKIQRKIRNNEHLYKIPTANFVNPKENEKFYSLILLTNDQLKIKKYCGEFYKARGSL